MQIMSPRLQPVQLAGIWNEKGQDAWVGSMHAGTNREKIHTVALKRSTNCGLFAAISHWTLWKSAFCDRIAIESCSFSLISTPRPGCGCGTKLSRSALTRLSNQMESRRFVSSGAPSSATMHVVSLLSPDSIAVPSRWRMCWPLALNWGLTWWPFNIYQERAILYAHLIAQGSQLIIKWYTRQHILWLLRISEEALLFERTGIVRPQEKSWALPRGVERGERAAPRKPWCLSL